jgi:hypothetical protein
MNKFAGFAKCQQRLQRHVIVAINASHSSHLGQKVTAKTLKNAHGQRAMTTMGNGLGTLWNPGGWAMSNP